MIIKPPLKNDSLNVIFNGNYDIEEKSKKQDKYEFASELKKINIELNDGDINKIVNKIVSHYNIKTIAKLAINYGDTKDIAMVYTCSVEPTHIDIKCKYVDSVDITAKNSIITTPKTNITKLKATCTELKVCTSPIESMEADCDIISIIGPAGPTTCKFNNIKANSFKFTQYRTDRDAVYTLIFTNCNIKKCHTHMTYNNYKAIATDSNIENWRIEVSQTNAVFTANNVNNIMFHITAYNTNSLSFEGEGKYTIAAIDYYRHPESALNLSYKDQIDISKSIKLAGVNLKNIDFPEKTLESFKNVLLRKFDEEYAGDDFLTQVDDAIKRKNYISVANLAKAVKLIKSKTKLTALYNLAHIYSTSFYNAGVINDDGAIQMYSPEEIIDVLVYADKRGIIDSILNTHKKDMKQILSDSNVPEWLVNKCYTLDIDIKNIFLVKKLLEQGTRLAGIRAAHKILGYCDIIERKEFVINDFDIITNDERIDICSAIANDNIILVPGLNSKTLYIMKQLRINKHIIETAYNSGKFNTERYNLMRLLIGDVTLKERVDILMSMNINRLDEADLANIKFTDDVELNNKLCILKLAIKDNDAIDVFFDTKVFMSDAYNNYTYKQNINDILLSKYEVLNKLNMLNNTEINKIMGYDPSKYADLNYGSSMVNQLLLMERRKIKNNIIYRKLPRNTNTIYLDTVNELKSSYNKNSNEYAELKWIENNIDINGASGTELNKIDEYLIDARNNSDDNNDLKVYKLVTNIKKSYIEEKNIELGLQSLISKQKVLRMNLKNLSELNRLLEPSAISNVSSYVRGQSSHPINKFHLTLVWLRFNVDEVNKSIWVNETQTDMTKIFNFGKYDRGSFIPTETGNKLNDRLAYLIIYQFQFWVAKYYPDYTVVLPSYTTRKKLIGGDPTVNGYDNPAKKLKFTKGEYKDTSWYNVKKGGGLVWIWSPLTESKQV